ncbi:hypothetical protein WAI453_008148 [Rhynchosporium graminicola]
MHRLKKSVIKTERISLLTSVIHRLEKLCWTFKAKLDNTKSSGAVPKHLGTATINSMFRWYQDTAECYAFLDDFESNSSLSRLGESR